MQEKINCLHEKQESQLFGKPDNYDYSEFENLEEFNLDKKLLKEFLDIAVKLNLSQEAFKMLLNIALVMARKQNEFCENNLKTKNENEIRSWNKNFEDDSEIPSQNTAALREYMSVADNAYNEFASDKLKELMKTNGLIYHPEMIKMFHKIGEIMQEDLISCNGKPVKQELTPAQILYGTYEN